MSQLQVTGEAKIRDIQGPVVANSGVITALDGAASQYVRGDGTLADFPTSSGGGSSVSYYLNSSVSQGTIGGVAYRELSKEPIIGAGTDIAIAANGYVASYLTDANDPDVLSIPGGNFNCEFYFSVNNNTGAPYTYAELYKYDGTTFTLLGSSVGVPEYINQGTIIAPYYFAIPVPTSALAVTDRLAIRIYVNVDGRTVTLHTENSHLCQVVTTLSKGMVSLNNLTDQSQYITTGTSGTDFNIVSSGDTHTFNIPSASASNRGLITTGSQTIAGIKTLSVPSQFEQGLYLKQNINLFQAGYIGLGASTTGLIVGLSGGGFGTLNFNNTTSFTYTFPNATGTIALTSDLSSYVPYTGATANVDLGSFELNAILVKAITLEAKLNGTASGNLVLRTGTNGYGFGNNAFSLASSPDYDNTLLLISNKSAVTKTALFNINSLTADRTYTFPDVSGTIALTSNINYPVTSVFGRTGAVVAASGDYTTTQVTEGTNLYFTDARSRAALSFTAGSGAYNSTTGVITIPTNNNQITNGAGYITSSALSGYVPYTGATTNVNLGVYNLTANQVIVGGAGVNNAGTFTTYDGGVANLLIGSTGNLKFFPFWNPSLGARINAENSAGSAYIPLTISASVINLGGALSGTSATFNAGVVSQGAYTGFQYNSAGSYPAYNTYFGAIGTNFSNSNSELDIWNTVGGGFVFRKQTGASAQTALLTIASNGAATFSSSVSSGGIQESQLLISRQFSKVWNLTSDGNGFLLNNLTDGTYPIKVLNGGNVGIGTSAPGNYYSTKLVVAVGDEDGITIAGSGDNFLMFADGQTGLDRYRGFIHYSHDSNFLAFGSDGAERMRLTSNGSVCINATSPGSNSPYLYNYNGDGSRINAAFEVSVATPGFTSIQFRNPNGSVGSIAINTSSVSYNTTSDYRLKEDLKDLNGLDKVSAIKVYDYKWKSCDERMDGVLAHELAEVLPYAVNGKKDGEQMQGVDYSKIVPVLVKAIQELTQKVNELESKNK